MSWISTGVELADAVETLEASGYWSFSTAKDTLEYAYEVGGIDRVNWFLRNNGVGVATGLDGKYNYFIKNSVESLSPAIKNVFYPEVVEGVLEVAETGEEIVTFSSLPATTTVGGANVVKNAVQTLAKVEPFIGAVATGVGLGWESYKRHPEEWTAISDAIFAPVTGDIHAVTVLNRMIDGKSLSTIREDDLALVLQQFANRGAFKYGGGYESNIGADVKQGDIIDATWTPVHFAGTSDESTACAIAEEKFHEFYPSFNIYALTISIYTGGILGVTARGMETNTSSPFHTPNTVTAEFDSENKFFTRGIFVKSVFITYNPTTKYFSVSDQGTQTASFLSGQFVDGVYGLNVTYEEPEGGDNEAFPLVPTASPISIKPNTSIADIKTKLKETYPEWYNKSHTVTGYNPSTGENEDVRYYPLSFPNVNPFDGSLPEDNYNQQTAQDGEIKPEEETQGKNLTENTPRVDEENPDLPIPTPPTPPYTPIVVDGSGTDLFAIYNPTKSEISELGRYLWSSNIVDIISKFLNNPMDAIISLHMIYCTPIRGDRKNIVLGYLNSGVSSITVAKQFVDINCGKVFVDEYFNDVRDYSPYTMVEAYLPFIGIVKLKSEDIINSYVSIKYSVDVLTGAVLCKIFVTKSGTEQQLYSYSGNCSVQIPLTGSDRTRLLSGAVSSAITGAVVGGGAGAVVGALAGGLVHGSSIERSGNFTANAGAMGIKKPYLIISRKYGYDAYNYNNFYGYPSNKAVVLGNCKGYTRVKEVHVDNISIATDKEKKEIETILLNGVII